MKRVYSSLENKYKSPSKATLTSNPNQHDTTQITQINSISHINSISSTTNVRSNSSSINLLKSTYEKKHLKRKASIVSPLSVI